MNTPYKNYLFNFSSSHTSGGLKRLTEYANWFNIAGGAKFIIRSECSDLVDKYPNIEFFVIAQKKYERLFNDSLYLKKIIAKIGIPDVYFAYGIPMYNRVGRVNWFHVSNVLPFMKTDGLIPFSRAIKIKLLGFRIKKYLFNCDVISAESKSSLLLLDKVHSDKFFVSVNGSDDELEVFAKKIEMKKENQAAIVGTYKYKALEDAFFIFKELKIKEPLLKLVIIGNPDTIPANIKIAKDIIIKNIIPRQEVIKILQSSKYYISTTKVENSFNAASEGIFLATESFISDIEPHKELLENLPYEIISVKGLHRKILKVKRENITTINLKKWYEVIHEMNSKINDVLFKN